MQLNRLAALRHFKKNPQIQRLKQQMKVNKK